MSVVIVGGNDRMATKYQDICKAYKTVCKPGRTQEQGDSKSADCKPVQARRPQRHRRAGRLPSQANTPDCERILVGNNCSNMRIRIR